MFGRTLRMMNRKVRWLGRIVGVFLAFFTFELLNNGYEPDILGAADPYAGAALAYIVGGWLVAFSVAWFISAVIRTFSRLLGRG